MRCEESLIPGHHVNDYNDKANEHMSMCMTSLRASAMPSLITPASGFTASKLRQNAKAEAAFALFDKDGKGLVCLDDVARVASELGETFTADELEEMVHEADPSGEGLIDQKGFFRIVRKLNL
ncbi:hypothetical protein MHU86_23115 [Fragilaria crotonensis]|nr:hypothetical protein MHU86_23115 [Fragilaria crotonensis]